MREPKITLFSNKDPMINADFGKEAYSELKEIDEKGETEEYGFQLTFPKGYKKLKPNDIILISYSEIDIYAEVKMCLEFTSGKQEVEFRYKKFVFKEN